MPGKIILLSLMLGLAPCWGWAQTRVVPGSAVSYVYSPGSGSATTVATTTTTTLSGDYGCYKFKMDPAQLSTMGSHGLFGTTSYVSGTTGDDKYQNMQILSLGVVSGSPPTFSGILRLASCPVKVATTARRNENTCGSIDTHITRCDSSWSGEPNYGKGLSACVFTAAAGVLNELDYVEVNGLPVSNVTKSSSCSPTSGMWDNTTY